MVGKYHKCSECSKTFSTKQCYVRHVRIHRGEKPFKCDTCDKSFTQASNLKRHLRVHTGERPFTCSECDAKFAEKGTLVRHMKVHTREKSFGCNLCPKKYRFKGDFKRHLRIHMSEPFKCEACDYQTFHRCNLRRHVKNVHEPEGSSLLQCTLCVKTFKGKMGLELHIRGHTGEKPYKCKFCGTSFVKLQSMKACIWRHTGEKPYENQRNPHKCRICLKYFKAQSELKVHMSVHTDEKPFHCIQCTKRFGRKSSLVEHLVGHNGGNYKCIFCGKEFVGPSRLARHLRLHTGEEPFKCKLCPHRCRGGVQKSHMMRHEKEGKFKCRLCTFTSQINCQLLEHVQNDHGSDIFSIVNESYPAWEAQIPRGSEGQPFICNDCKFSCSNKEYLCIHTSQCHGLPFVSLVKLDVK